MQPIWQELEVPAEDTDGIAEAQQLPGAGDLVLDGLLVTDGVAYLEIAQRVGIASTGNLSGVNFTVYGTAKDGSLQSEVVVGPDNETVSTQLDYLTVLRIAVSAAIGTDVEVGTIATASFPMVVLDQYLTPFNVTVSLTPLEGSGSASAEFTLDPVFDQRPPYRWYPQPDLQGITTQYTAGTLISPVSASRATITGASKWRFGIQQAGVMG